MANAPQPETSILAPLDPSVDTKPDDWPEYELANARVHLANGTDTEANVSLLLATEHHPLTVTGQLQAVPQDLAHRYRGSSTKRTDAVEISDVRLFAYGQYADNSVALWAAGRAGWYTLKPSRGYRETYNQMVEAVRLLYFVADAYREPRRSGKGKHATTLPQYSARELFEKYATDVLGDTDALEDAEERACGHRDFLIMSMIAGKEGMDWSKNPLYLYLRKKFPRDYEEVVQRVRGPSTKAAPSQKTRQQSVDTGSTTSSLKRKRGRPPVKRGADVISLDSSSAASSVTKEARSQTAETSKSRAAPQAKSLAVRRTRHTPSAPTTETVSEASAPEPEPSATPEISDSEVEPSRQARKGKSALRPRPSEGVSKSGKGKAPVAEDNEDEEVAEPRSSPTGAKRKLDASTHARHRKRRNSKQEVDEGIDIPSSPSAKSEPDATAGAISPPPAADLAHVPDPVQEDTWLCALDGCTHKVYLASQAESQRLIREHYALHAYDDDRRVQMVRLAQAPSLPVVRLMEKVRAQARIEGFPGSRVAGSRFPVAVVQRY